MHLWESLRHGFELVVGWVVGDAWQPDGTFSVFKWIKTPAGFGIFVVIALELLFPFKRRGWQKSHYLNLTYFIFGSKISFFLFVVVPWLKSSWIRYHLPTLNLDQVLHPALFMIISLLVVGFVDYWSHRLVHRIPILWHIHKVHHAPEDLTFATLFHHHFLMDVVAAPFMTVMTLVLGTHLVPPWGAFHLLVSFIQHANISPRFGWLNYVFAGPEIHRYHHSCRPEHYDTNFSGVLVYWDMIFGTYHYDPREPATEFGLGEQVPEGFWRQQIAPLVWIAKDVARASPLKSLQAWGAAPAPASGGGGTSSAPSPGAGNS